MYIQGRRVGETIVVGNDIYITILGYKNRQVRIAVSAPEGLIIRRKEELRRGQDCACNPPHTPDPCE